MTGQSTLSSPLTNAIEDLRAAFSSYDPTNARDLQGMIDDLPGFFEGLASAFKFLSDKADQELPIGKGTVAGMQEGESILAGLKDHFDDVKRTFYQEHEAELNRLDNPRPKEEAWDVKANQ